MRNGSQTLKRLNVGKGVNTNKITVNERDSYYIYIIKAIAIFFVITAHVNSVVDNKGLITNIISLIWNRLGSVAVPLFLICSAFFYHRERGDAKFFWMKKLVRIVIPWLILSAATYILQACLANDFGFFDYFKWMIGYKTWYYFVTILLIYFLVFKFLDKNVFLISCIVINFVSVVFGYYNINIIDDWVGTYLNIFNMIGYFAFGMLLKKYRFDLIIFAKKYIAIIMAIIAFTMLALDVTNETLGYIRIPLIGFIIKVFTKIMLVFLIMCISYSISGFKQFVCFVFVGKQTYFIYLIHMQIVQFVCNRLPINIFSVIFNPFIGYAIMIVISLVVYLVCKKLIKSDIPLKLMGMAS